MKNVILFIAVVVAAFGIYLAKDYIDNVAAINATVDRCSASSEVCD